VAQGIGGGLLEEMMYDEQGQLLTGTFMDYLVPTSMEVPDIETVHLEYPSPRNPLGVKGIGEGGAISPPAAIANAVEDALAPFGVRVTRAPLGPSRVLELIAEGAARLAAAEARREARPFEYHAARSSAEAVEVLARHGDAAKVLAGGQSLVPMLNFRLARRECSSTSTTRRISTTCARPTASSLVGALVRQRKLERWAADRAPLIAEALRLVGHVAIRNRGTAVGNLAHGDPASELPALLLCLDGAVVARNARGRAAHRRVELYLAPLTTSLAADEILAEARFTLPPAGAGWGFAEVARRHGDFALAGCAALLWRDGRGASPAREWLLRCRVDAGAGERRRRSAARSRADAGPVAGGGAGGRRGAVPRGDLHATADYRRRVAGVLAERTLIARSSGAAAGHEAGGSPRRQRAAACGRRGGAHLPGRLPPRGPGPDGHARGLRARRLWRVHRAPRGRAGARLPHARGAGGGAERHDHRGSSRGDRAREVDSTGGGRRRASPDPAGIHG
jgi:carbon-monoxide dehydrogenase medium subunit